MDIKIAIIDSGVDSSHERLKNVKLSGTGFVFDDNKVVQTENYHDETGHGTAIAAIIQKHCPVAEIHCVKVFSGTMFIHEDVLYKALEYCIQSRYPIINLSLGVNINPPPEQLIKLCRHAYENHIFLICASNNSPQHPAYPASLPYVFGVGSGANIKKSAEYGFMDDSAIDFLAKGTTQRIAWKNGAYNIAQGTSYACAHFAGIVAKKISENKFESFEKLKQALKQSADPQVKPFIYYNSIHNMDYVISNNDIKCYGEKFFVNQSKFSWIKKVAMFPVSNKELSVFYKYSDLYNVEFSYFIDFQKSYPNVFFENIEEKTVLNSLPDQHQWDNIDTLVVGYYLDEMFEVNIHFGNSLLKKALELNKNIFYLDPRLDNILKELRTDNKHYSGIIYHPQIDEEMHESLKVFKYLPEIKIPVLAVIGTSSKQGKLSTQLVINKILKKEGYKVGFFSTEPQGELYDASFAFPYGYLSTVSLDVSSWYDTINCILKGMQEFNSPHIIVTGIQSGLIPRSMNQMGSGITEIKSLAFLTAIKPDGIICVVNPDDSIETIQNTITVARIYTGAELLFLVLNPYRRTNEQGELDFKKLSPMEYAQKREGLVTQLNMPVWDIMNEINYPTIVSMIEDSFS